jgi:hypothetical protein
MYTQNHLVITPQEAKIYLDKYPISIDKGPAGVAEALSFRAGISYRVVFDGKTQEALAALGYHKSALQYKKGPKSQLGFWSPDESTALDMNVFLRNVRVFGFDRTAEMYNLTKDSNIRNAVLSHLKNKVFHVHFGNNPTHVIEFQLERDPKVLIVRNIDTHENFKFATDLADINKFNARLEFLDEQLRENLGNKIYRSADCDHNIERFTESLRA